MRVSSRTYAEALYEAVKAASEKELPAIMRRLLVVLQQRRHWGMLPKIMRSFDDVLYEREGLLDVELKTARAHTKEHMKHWIGEVLKVAIPDEGKRRVNLTQEVDPSLVGGMTMRTRGYVYDGSVKGWMQQLKLRLSK